MRWYETIIAKLWWHNSFLAFFRKDGKHRTCAIGVDCWNERFIEAQTKDLLNPAWEEKLSPPDQFFDGAIKKLTRAIDLPNELGRMPGSVPLPMDASQGVIEVQISGIEAAHLKRKAQYQEALANIKLDATLDSIRAISPRRCSNATPKAEQRATKSKASAPASRTPSTATSSTKIP